MSLKERLDNLVEEYASEEDTDRQSALRDILTDLRHTADEKDLDFDYAINGSEEVYEEEIALQEGTLGVDKP